MLNGKLTRCALALAVAAAVLAPAAATLAQPPSTSSTAAGPADAVQGYYRGTITEGTNAGTAVMMTVVKQRPDKIQFKSNLPAQRDADTMIKVDGAKTLPADGSTLKFSFDASSKPTKLEYTDAAGRVFVGTKVGG